MRQRRKVVESMAGHPDHLRGVPTAGCTVDITIEKASVMNGAILRMDMAENDMVRQAEIKCYLCGGTEHRRRPGKVRDDGNMEILECRACGLVFLSRNRLPEGFYEQSGMHCGEPQPIGEWLRDTDRDDERRYRYLSETMTNRDVLDFGCGVGGFLLKARSPARRVMGVELESRLYPHFQANGLDVFPSVADLPPQQRFHLITAFHVLEHLEDPAAVLRQLSEKLFEQGKIFIEVPSSADALLTLYGSAPFSEFTYWSCHLYLFNAVTLPLLARKAGLKVEYVGHVQRYPLSNHLHWLAKGKPGGHQVWSFLDSRELCAMYEARLAALGLTDTLVARLSL
jgi:SAM-dependent methyltransferase